MAFPIGKVMGGTYWFEQKADVMYTVKRFTNMHKFLILFGVLCFR